MSPVPVQMWASSPVPAITRSAATRHCSVVRSALDASDGAGARVGPRKIPVRPRALLCVWFPYNANPLSQRTLCHSAARGDGRYNDNTLRSMRFYLDPIPGGLVLRQLLADVRFLATLSLMDYSLLIGVQV